MNLDQQIRAALVSTRWHELIYAIRAVLDLHHQVRTPQVPHPICPACSDERDAYWPCPTVKAIAAQLGITEKQDETDTGCTCVYGAGSDPLCPTHQRPAGLIGTPVDVTPEEFTEFTKRWYADHPDLDMPDHITKFRSGTWTTIVEHPPTGTP